MKQLIEKLLWSVEQLVGGLTVTDWPADNEHPYVIIKYNFYLLNSAYDNEYCDVYVNTLNIPPNCI